MAILMPFSCALPLSPSFLLKTRLPDGVSWDRSRRLRLDSSLAVAAAAAAANYKWLFVRWIRWLNGRERNRLINERQEERGREGERKGGRIVRRRCLTSFSGGAKKGRQADEREREREKGKPTRPTRERHFQMQMKTEWSKKRMRGGGEGWMDGWGVGEGGERNNKSVIDRGRAARRE